MSVFYLIDIIREVLLALGSRPLCPEPNFLKEELLV